MNDRWLEITVEAPGDELDDVCAKLTAAGMSTFAVEDELEFRQFLEENRHYWDYVDDALMERMKGAARVKFYVTDDADGRAQLDRYAAALARPYTAAALGESDWAHSWQKYYKPITVGNRFMIVPEWEKGVSVPPGRVPLYLNPGLIFGTGSHPSTQLCLEGLENHVRPGGAVLDLGCGSVILSIAALALGADSAVGVDIDPKAAGVAYENAALNGMGRDRYAVFTGDILSDDALMERLSRGRFDLILANIVADVIISLSGFVRPLLAPGGVFLCSGIIDTRAGEVAAALEANGLSVREKPEKNGWVAFAAEQNSAR
jgi:ribosomal protein L11 methyltransferase